MSILIKGMEMPKNCSSCPFCFGANNICPWVREYATYKGRHTDCPLVPVQPHGRLIDADALIKSDRMVGKMMMYGAEYVYTQAEIDRAPTVIEAEEDE